jgi:hypothetical protein
MLSTGFPAEYFSIIWSGKLRAPSTETFRLSLDTYNSSEVKLTLNGQLLINNDHLGLSTNLYSDVSLIEDEFYDLELRPIPIQHP